MEGNMGIVWIVVLVVYFAIMMFMASRRNKKQQQQMLDFINGLKKGDEVILAGGLHAELVSIKDEDSYATVLLGNNEVKVEKSAIIRLADNVLAETSEEKEEDQQ